MIYKFIQYLKGEKRVSGHTLIAYRNDLRQFGVFLESNYPDLKDEDGDLKIEDCDYGMIRAWLIQSREEGNKATIVNRKIAGNKATSVNRKIATLRTFFKFLMRDHGLKKNPMQKIRILKTQKRLPSFVKEGDMQNLLDRGEFGKRVSKKKELSEKKEPSENRKLLEKYYGHLDKLILELFYATGIRLSELIQLEESNVNMSVLTIKVLGKGNKERVIPFPSSLLPVLEAYKKIRNEVRSKRNEENNESKKRNKKVKKKNNGYLFETHKGEPCYPMLVYRIVTEYLTKYAVSDKKSPHVLRHTYATHLLNKGAEINAVKDLLGHSSLAATQVYTHNSMEKIKKAYDQAHPKA